MEIDDIDARHERTRKATDLLLEMLPAPTKPTNTVVFMSEQLLNDILTTFINQTASKTQIYSLILFFSRSEPWSNGKFFLKYSLFAPLSGEEIDDYKYQVIEKPCERNELNQMGVRLSDCDFPSESLQQFQGLYFRNYIHFALIFKSIVYSLLGLKVIQFQDDSSHIGFLKNSDFLSTEYLIEFAQDIEHGVHFEVPEEVVKSVYTTGLKVLKAQRVIFSDVQRALQYIGDTDQSERFKEIIEFIKNSYSKSCSKNNLRDVINTYIPDSKLINVDQVKRKIDDKRRMKKLNGYLRNTPVHNQNTTQQDRQDSSSELENSAQWEQITNLFMDEASRHNFVTPKYRLDQLTRLLSRQRKARDLDWRMHQGDFGPVQYYKSEHSERAYVFGDPDSSAISEIWAQEVPDDDLSDLADEDSDEDDEEKEDQDDEETEDFAIASNFATRSDKIFQQYASPNRIYAYETTPWQRSTSELLLRNRLGLGSDIGLDPKSAVCDINKRLVPRASAISVAETLHTVHSGAFLHGGDYYAYTGSGPLVRIMNTTDLANPREIGSIDLGWLYDRDITDFSYSELSNCFLCSSNSRKISLFKVNLEPDSFSKEDLGCFNTSDVVSSSKLSEDGSCFIAGHRKGLLTYSHVDLFQTIQWKLPAEKEITSVQFLGNGKSTIAAGSDDGICHIFDTRSNGNGPVQVLVGHQAGIMYLEGYSNENYIISNSKDQTIKLWDLRLLSTAANNATNPSSFDYKRPSSNPSKKRKGKDSSLMTYRGHTVSQERIKCHFSPSATTGGQYIYSGSEDDRIYIWDIDGSLLSVLHDTQKDPRVKDPSAIPGSTPSIFNPSCVIRDVNWHPQMPALYACVGRSRYGIGSGEVLYVPFNHRYEVVDMDKRALDDGYGRNGANEGIEKEYSLLSWNNRRRKDNHKNHEKAMLERASESRIGTSEPLVRGVERENRIGSQNYRRVQQRRSNQGIEGFMRNRIRGIFGRHLDANWDPLLEVYNRVTRDSSRAGDAQFIIFEPRRQGQSESSSSSESDQEEGLQLNDEGGIDAFEDSSDVGNDSDDGDDTEDSDHVTRSPRSAPIGNDNSVFGQDTSSLIAEEDTEELETSNQNNRENFSLYHREQSGYDYHHSGSAENRFGEIYRLWYEDQAFSEEFNISEQGEIGQNLSHPLDFSDLSVLSIEEHDQMMGILLRMVLEGQPFSR